MLDISKCLVAVLGAAVLIQQQIQRIQGIGIALGTYALFKLIPEATKVTSSKLNYYLPYIFGLRFMEKINARIKDAVKTMDLTRKYYPTMLELLMPNRYLKRVLQEEAKEEVEEKKERKPAEARSEPEKAIPDTLILDLGKYTIGSEQPRTITVSVGSEVLTVTIIEKPKVEPKK